MSDRIRKRALIAAALAGGALAAGGWLNARAIDRASAQRRARNDRGRPVEVRGAAGNRIAARVHGPDGAPTLILVHCWTGTQELWHKQVDALADEFRIVTYDHRGHGISEDAPDGDYSLEAFAADLEAVIDATVPEGERPLLAGHSMGAMTIAAWADALRERTSERARGAALMSTGLEALTSSSAVLRQLPGRFDTIRGRVTDLALEAPVSLKGVPLDALRAAVAYVALGPNARAEDVELTMRMALDCRPIARARAGRAMARMKLLHALDDLRVPTIVIAGGKDRMTPISHAERIDAALPHSLGLRVEPDCGHMTPLECPELVNHALREMAAAALGEPEQAAA
ncbi:MAG TPA: alpha/beta hydrolase [Solirubrobacterales bacterium]|jgi:pimeloyl-ACP methyl ester carboxylesterase